MQSASLLQGTVLAREIRQTIKDQVRVGVHAGRRPPGLAVILVGEDPASQIYVKHKRAACIDVGYRSYAYDLPENIEEKALLSLVDTLNRDPDLDGILVQLPLPPQINTQRIIEAIDPRKDVDGFHPYNLGRLAQGAPRLRPCTPYGIIQLLDYYHLPLVGKHVVIVGASNIVGRPLALECLLAKATVTICHRATVDLKHHVECASILVLASGTYNVVDPNWLHQEQIVIDVGIHRTAEGTLHGDLHFDAAVKKVSWITPVPGGVGPMTVSVLLENTLLAANLS